MVLHTFFFFAKFLLILFNILHVDKDLTKSPSKPKDDYKNKDKKDDNEKTEKEPVNKKDESNINIDIDGNSFQ